MASNGCHSYGKMHSTVDTHTAEHSTFEESDPHSAVLFADQVQFL